jgi:hypothetical protein
MFVSISSPRPAAAWAVFLCSLLQAAAGDAHEPVAEGGAVPVLEPVVVTGRADDLVGIAPTASSGQVGQGEISRIPFLRSGEILEVVPGLVATQHSGTGKANQFFLRGFNLDHGTDFSTFVEGVPLNLPSHGHGQGYLDLNSVIPELVATLAYRKGPYYADVGDFSSAGTSSIEYMRRLEGPLLRTGAGSFGYSRTVVADSSVVRGGDLLVAGEAQFYDGPWVRDESLAKWNGLAKWTHGDDEGGVGLFFSAYTADWDSSDQIPLRAVRSGRISRRGFLDDAPGGKSTRLTASARWWKGHEKRTRAQVWLARYELDLWSNFTYFLDDPENGDEFEQLDRRTVAGFDIARDLPASWGDLELFHSFGIQGRHDAVDDVGLFRTADRRRLSTTRRDSVDVSALALWWQSDLLLGERLRATAGLRADGYRFDVDARSLTENSGRETDLAWSPKFSLVAGPWSSTEVYASYGRSFHSNDARGTTIRIDPATGEDAEQVDPLVASQGAEIGVRSTRVPGLHTTLALWWLDLDSELLFVGDAGATEATRPSRRWGVEFASFWKVRPWLTLDGDVTWSDARFDDDEPGAQIPGAVATTVAAGATVDFPHGWFGSLRLRHFGKRPLLEDGSVESDATTLWNLQAGWRAPTTRLGDFEFTLDALNLLDANDDDITYFYESRLPGEDAGGVADRHFHPVEPRALRAYVTWRP